ncbi:DUF4266 domain-containing protein [Massilia dura]|uniref:DUF4266 domain-containing protein n=1 Tax=Pseudoduganella dura TaxID=321982 RepID=A0A6I3XVK0_9BURK|nr:DUF4266 domain-containing protein [Pseudoduganella dura]MUI15755.1 DUF4266 domain-containing protein [Pseudoduganella dura]GGX89128.1 hypothetical protein GCM10007386_19930 [Pseudoduganella dura]
MTARITIALGWLALAALLAGCAGVQPWEKGKLARPEMTFGADTLETRFAEHIYTSREGAAGGAGVGGGGCGCN